tara:strand:+ start:1574 stop:2098 length:525 start_codon:yes stop_codon:yes gene_type:complete
MQKKIIEIIVFFLIIFFIGVFFIGLNKSSIYDTNNLVGQKLTNINLKHFSENKLISEKDLKEKNFTLINFWASWCAPCREEHPFLLKLKEQKNIKLIGVNFKDNKNNALNFIKNFGDPYDDIARDEFGKQSVNFGIYGIPESILINKELIIIKKFIGPLSNEDFNFIKRKVNQL